jgi:hypothetical protein
MTTKTKSGGLAETNPTGLNEYQITIVNNYLIVGGEHWHE